MAQPIDYMGLFQSYPVNSVENAFDGAIKRFSSFPFPKDVYDFALMGLPKIFPLTKEPITVDLVTPFLESAIPEIEMNLGMCLSPTEKWQSYDFVEGCWSANYSGTRLQYWPATQVSLVQLKFPHTNLNPAVMTYTVPSQWVCLRRNMLNIIASYGSVTVATSMNNLVNAGGLFTFLSGFSTGSYRPAVVEVRYTAGFDSDKLPSNVADLIKTWAALNLLQQVIAQMFPITSTEAGIDGIRQSATTPIFQAMQARLAYMDQHKKDLIKSIKKNFGRSIPIAFIGA